MPDTGDQMLGTKSSRFHIFAGLAALLCVVWFAGSNSARAQEPPTTIPEGGVISDPNAIRLNGWLLYPALNLQAESSNNFFSGQTSKVSGWGFSESPSMTAEWSNGIHSTTLFGTYTHIDYPTGNEFITNDGQATFTQQYAPLRDLSFTVSGDYTHRTISSTVTNAIPSAITSTAATVLPNGNIQLPNGTIVSPSGQVVGQASAPVNAGVTASVNPYDQYTASGKVSKIFPNGILELSTSIQRADYEMLAAESANYTAATYNAHTAFWLGSVFYAYSDGSFAMRQNAAPNPDTNSYRVTGGIGTRQFGLFRATAYFGYQSTETAGSGTAGGDLFGGSLSYFATPLWTISGNIDETINHSSSQVGASTVALNIPNITPVQVPVTSSTAITSTSLQTGYQIAPKWSANAVLGYTRIEYLGSSGLTTTFFVDSALRYDIWRNLTLSWEYQHTKVLSNLPLTGITRSLAIMTASYRF